MNQGISVSVVSDCRLYDGLKPHQRQRLFLLASVKTSSEFSPAFYPMGGGSPFPGHKAWLWHNVDHLLPSSVEVKNE
jgi:hypothetical protein